MRQKGQTLHRALTNMCESNRLFLVFAVVLDVITVVLGRVITVMATMM